MIPPTKITPKAPGAGQIDDAATAAAKAIDKANDAAINANRTNVATNFEPKIEKQMSQRGWTKDSVNDTINNPTKKFSTIDERHNKLTGKKNNDPATIYEAKDGSYVIKNDRTGDIVQVSDKADPNWKWPNGIKEIK